MNTLHLLRSLRLLALLPALLLHLPASAGPGAHGPDGEHLDAPAGAHATGATPRTETQSDLVELVARLAGGELSVTIDRYDSNEPVLGAAVEVESDGMRAAAQFHADHGDYAFTDPALLAALSRPGDHALVFTVRSGEEAERQEADLLDAVLHVDAEVAPDEHASVLSRVPAAAWIVAAAIALAAAALLARRGRTDKGVRA